MQIDEYLNRLGLGALMEFCIALLPLARGGEKQFILNSKNKFWQEYEEEKKRNLDATSTSRRALALAVTRMALS